MAGVEIILCLFMGAGYIAVKYPQHAWTLAAIALLIIFVLHVLTLLAEARII